MTKKHITDDSIRVIQYYHNLLSDTHRVQCLHKIVALMKAWSNTAKTGALGQEDRNVFSDALRDKNEYIWYEAGSRLAQLLPENTDVQDIFASAFKSTNAQARFNVVALARSFPKNFARQVLAQAISDKSSKVRIKAADMILILQDKEYLQILKERLPHETNEKVRCYMVKVLDNFDNFDKDKEGAVHSTIG
ncbi:MAG: HEAT repeat domain-containing protein [Planctomycetes bacterium]|nr:HEAT repeat domain-containing protein [Planctomycetota bacterium]